MASTNYSEQVIRLERFTDRLIIFIPGTPQGKGRARSVRTKNRAGEDTIAHYTPEATLIYEERIRSEATCELLMKRTKLLLNPVKLKIVAQMPVPQRWPKWKKELALKGLIAPTVKPDLDNIEKVVLDAFNKIVWKDDTQVVKVEKSQFYATRVGVGVIIEETPQFSHDIRRQDLPPDVDSWILKADDEFCEHWYLFR